ncbi:MAG: MATE family efflux transporter [Thermoguttaceae bacterium]
MIHHTHRHLEEGPIGRLLWLYSTPAILGMVVSATYTIVDRIFVGWMIGPVGIAAVTLSFPITLVMIAFGMLIGIGSNTLMSIRLGEKRFDDAEKIVGQCVFLFLLVSTVFGVSVAIWADPLLRVFGASEQSLPQARQFLVIIAAGSFFHMVSFGVNSFLRGEGKPQIAMASLLLAAILNIVFDWFFLCVLKTDVWGAAVATVLAQAVTTCWIFWFYLSGRTVVKMRLKHIRFHSNIAREICYFGSAAFVMQVAACAVQGLTNRQLTTYSDTSLALIGHTTSAGAASDLAIATMGIVFAVGTLFVMPLIGISQGLQPIAGYNLGANKPHRVRRVLLFALGYAMLFTVVAYALAMAEPQWLFAPFVSTETPDAERLIAFGTHATRIFFIGLPFVTVSIIASGYFQATGRPFQAMAITLTRQVLLLLPLTFFLPWVIETWWPGHGLEGVWIANPVADVIAGGLAITLLSTQADATVKTVPEDAIEEFEVIDGMV